MRPLRALLLPTLLLCVATAVQAQAPVGELLLEKGLVLIRRQGQGIVHREVGVRAPVFQGDVLRTGREARAKLFFQDGRDTVSMYGTTHFTLQAVTPQRSGFALGIGKAIFGVFSRLRQGGFDVRTSTATIGVKGTEFVVGTDGTRSFVLTLEGTVGLVGLARGEQEVVIGANKASSVSAGAPPAPPVDVSPEAAESIVAGEGLESFEALPIEAPAPEGGAAGEGEAEPAAEEPAAEEAAPEEAEVVSEVLQTVEQGTEEARPSSDVGAGGSIRFTVE